MLKSNNTAEKCMSSFTDIIDRLDLAKAALPMNHQVLLFTKGVVHPTFQLVLSKIRDKLQDGKSVNLQ